MKITKLSMVAIAAMTITTGAMADLVSDVKLDGQVKLWYETNDANDNGLFEQRDAGGNGVSSGDAALTVGATATVASAIKVGTKVYAVSTLGLENSVVAGTRAARTNGADNEAWLGELHATGTIGKTTIKAGRQALNTPFAFTENWNVVPNTFDAIVVINKDIENLTLIGASVARGNGNNTGQPAWKAGKTFNTLDATMVAGMTKIGSVPVNAYYYDVNNIAGTALPVSAYWADATVPVGPAKLTAIYAGAQLQGGGTSAGDIDAYALKATAKFGGVSLLGAYSSVGTNDGTGLAIANVGTGFKKTKLPTAGVYTDGLYVAQPGSDAFKIKAATKLAGFGVAAQYISNNNTQTVSKDTDEFDLIVSKKIGDIGVKAIFLNRTFSDAATATASDGNHVRIITSYNF